MRLTILMAAVALTAASAFAQPVASDLAFTTPNGVFYYDRLDTQAHTLRATAVTMQACQTAHWNDGVVTSDALGRLYRTTRLGTMTTLTTLANGWATAMTATPDGYAIAANTAGVSYLWFNSKSDTTLVSYGGANVNAICRDTKRGDQIVGLTSKHLLRVDRYGTTTTISTLDYVPSGVCYMPDVDRIVVTQLSTAEPLVIKYPSGATSAKRYLVGSTANCCTYDTRLRRLWVGTGDGFLYQFRSDLFLWGRYNSGQPVINGLDVWEDQNISLETTNSTGLSVRVRFRGANRDRYCLAASLSLTSGTYLSGAGTLYLAPDPLFALTVCGTTPGLTTNFTGLLSIQGTKTATLDVALLPKGVPVHVSGAVVDPAAPAGIRFGNTETYVW